MHREGQLGRRKTKRSYKKHPTSKTIRFYTEPFGNAEIPKMNFSLLNNPLVLFNRIFRAWLFILQKYNINKIDNLRSNQLFTTTKPQKPGKLTIDNSQLRNN
jgi:hypothetical protein